MGAPFCHAGLELRSLARNGEVRITLTVHELPYFAMRQNALGFPGENTACLYPQRTAP